MNFWDSSALLPLLIEETCSKKISDLFVNQEEDISLIWTLTPVEIVSTLCRSQRMKRIDESGFERAYETWTQLLKGLHLVKDIEAVKQRSLRILRTHPLKAADSLQLAAALVAVSDRPSQSNFITLDERLAIAAKQEGFVVLPG